MVRMDRGGTTATLGKGSNHVYLAGREPTGCCEALNTRNQHLIRWMVPSLLPMLPESRGCISFAIETLTQVDVRCMCENCQRQRFDHPSEIPVKRNIFGPQRRRRSRHGQFSCENDGNARKRSREMCARAMLIRSTVQFLTPKARTRPPIISDQSLPSRVPVALEDCRQDK